MSTKIKLTTKYYIKVHDKNLPGENGWKVDFELNSPDIRQFFKKEDFFWVDKFITFEKIFQEIEDENGYRTAYTKPINVREFDIENENGKFVVKEKKEDEKTL